MSASARAPLTWSIAWRFLRGRRSRLLTGTTRAALAATALGVMAMVIGMALMTGYREDLRRKLVRGNAAIVVYPLSQGGGEGFPVADLARLPGVEDVRRVVYGEGSLATEGVPGGTDVTVRGVDVDRFRDLDGIAWAAGVDPVSLTAGEPPPVVLGAELYRQLGGAESSGPARLMVLGFENGRPRFRYRAARIVGTFESGFAEFDQSWVVMDRGQLEGLVGDAAAAGVWEIAIEDVDDAAAVAELVEKRLGEGYLVSDWQELNRELFTALELQQAMLFLVLGLIVLVSTFNIASSLVVLVRERMRDMGVLAALGFPRYRHRRVFLAYGCAVGLLGTALGVALGAGVAWAFTTFEIIRFDPEVAAIYFISSVPFRVRGPDVGAIVAFTLVVTLVACWIPATRAARVAPASALRYE